MTWQPSAEIKNDAWFWRWLCNPAPMDDDPRGDLIKLVQKLNVAGTPTGGGRRLIEGLQANLKTIKDDSIRSFIQDAIKCYEGELYRPAILMSWMAAIYILYKHVHNKCLKEFNEEARSKDGKWKAAKEIDDLGRMKEVVFLDRLEALAVIDRTRRNQLGFCLALRNSCSHPSSWEISSTIADAHFEMLLHNVFSESRFTDDIAQPPETIGIELIQRRVGAFFDVRVGDLKSSNKQKKFSEPRQIAMFLCRKHTCYSFPEIARKFGGRNHSTAVHAVKNIERKMKEDPYIFNAVSEISRELEKN